MRWRRILYVLAGIGFALPALAAEPPGNGSDLRRAICRIVDEAAAANGIPRAFLALVLWHESRLHADATSPAGAEGVAQFLPKTAIERGLADPRDTRRAIAEAARLLAELNARFGNLGLAAAGYNAGAARVGKWLQAQAELPAETRRYVFAVTGHSADDWRQRGGLQRIAGPDPRACLEAVAAPARPGSVRAAQPAWLIRLERVLERAAAARTGVLRSDRRIDAGSPRAADGLCDAIRSLGANCEVYRR